MDLVEDLAEPGVSVVAACAALGVSRATLYRTTSPTRLPTLHQRAPSARRLDDSERQAILGVMHSEEFVDQPPMEVFAKLLSRGIYMASIRTFYRVLAELGESKEPPVPITDETAPPGNVSADGRRMDRRLCQNQLVFLPVTIHQRLGVSIRQA